MSSIWRRIQRTSKKAYQFEFTVDYKSLRLVLPDEQQWRPSSLVIVWKRRGRRFRTEALTWPDVEGMTVTILAWQSEESHSADVMMYKEASAKRFDRKDWEFSLENVMPNGQRKVIGSAALNLVDCVEDVLCENELSIRLVPCTNKVKKIHLDVNITAKFLHERKMSDGDSISSLTEDPAFEELDESDDETSSAGPTSRVTVGGRRGSDQSESKCVMDHKKTVTNSRQQVRSMLQESDSSSDSDDLHFTTPLSDLPAMEIPGEEELLDWCRRMTEGYPGVQIKNLTTSFRSGMAFCAIIDRFRQGLIDYPGLSMLNMVENNKTAFKAAEGIGVPRLLDPVELVECDTPDKLSVMTYIFQLKIHLGDSVDGVTTVSRYAKKEQEALGQLVASDPHAEEMATFSSGEASWSEDLEESSSDDSDSSDSEGDEVVRVPKNWKVQGANIEQKPLEEDGKASDDPTEDTPDKQAQMPSSKSGKPAVSMYAELEDSASDASPQLAVRSKVLAKDSKDATQRQVDEGDSDEQLELFTASGDVIVKPASGCGGGGGSAEAAPIPRRPIIQAGPKPITPNLDDYKQPTTPNAIRKLKLMERAKKMVQEQEQLTGMPFVSPVSKATPTSSGGTTADESRQHWSASAQVVKETGIDDDLTLARENPFNSLPAACLQAEGVDAAGTASASAESPGDRKVKKKKKKMKKEGKPKRVKGTAEEEAERKRRRKERKARKLEKQRKKEEAAAAAAAAEGTTTITAPTTAASDTSQPGVSTQPGASAVAGSKPQTTSTSTAKKTPRPRPTRQPLPISKSSSQVRRQLSAKAEVERLRQAESGSSIPEGITFMPSAMDTAVQGWHATKFELARSPSNPDDLLDVFEYAHLSLKTIEKRQADLDRRGNRLEMRVRQAMGSGDQAATGKLMQQWFQLIAQKNILLRQGEDLDLLGEEDALKSQFEQVNRRLRHLMAVEEHKKSREQKETEERLMAQLGQLLKQRDAVAQRLHQREIQAQQEDERVETAISQTAKSGRAARAGAAAAAGDDKACVIS